MRQTSSQEWAPLEARIARIEAHLAYVATKEMMQQAATDREKIRGEIQAVRTDIQVVHTYIQRNSKNTVIFLVTTGIAIITTLVALIGAIADWF